MVLRYSFSSAVWLSCWIVLYSFIVFRFFWHYFCDSLRSSFYTVSLHAAMHFCCVKVVWRFSNIWTLWGFTGYSCCLMNILTSETHLNAICISWQSVFFWLSMDLYNGNMWAHRDQPCGMLGHSSVLCRDQLIFFLRITKVELVTSCFERLLCQSNVDSLSF